MLAFRNCNFFVRFAHNRRAFSALYITDDKAQKNFVLLNPVIDFEDQLQHKELLLSNISSRCINTDLDKLIRKWEFFQFINERKNLLEHVKSEISLSLTDLLKNPDQHKDEIEKLKLHIKVVKDDLKNIKTFYYGVEEDTMLRILNLPNVLDESTPLQEEKVIFSFLENHDGASKSHLQIGCENGILNYINSYACFLKSDAALFELHLLNKTREYLEKSGYVQFISPSFCRSIVSEGCGVEPSELLCIEEDESADSVNKLHFCGGSSLPSFMAYFARHTVLPNILPIRYFSLGKKYQASSESAEKSLFSLTQQSVVSVFVATTDEENCLESIIDDVTAIYQEFGHHFKLLLLPACQLDKVESLHVSIQMFSNFLGQYVEVGNISVYNNYLSKRLLFTYTENNENKIRKYPKIISGTVVNIPKILGCVLENNSLKGVDLLANFMKTNL